MKLFTQLWDFFASVKLAIFTLCTLAVTSIIGTVIPQGESFSFYAQKYGPKAAHFFKILDIGEMYYSWWFLGLLALLSANLIICSFDRFPRVWKIISADNLQLPPERVKKMSVSNSWELQANDTDFDLESVLKENGWNASSATLENSELHFSQKGKWSRTGVYLVHVSILVIFVGAIIGHFTGFKGSVMIPELQSTDRIFSFEDSSAIELGFEVRNDEFVIEFYDNGMPKEYRSTLIVSENGKEILTQDIEVNGPLTHKGITFYQSSYQEYQDFIFTITDNSTNEQKKFTVPFQEQESWSEKGIRFGVINAEALGRQVVRSKIWFKSAEKPAEIKWADNNQETTFQIGETSFSLSAKQMYATGLQVAKDPGVPVVYLGCALMIIGLYMAFFLSHRRIWLLKENNGTTTTITLAGSSNKNKVSFKKMFDQLEAKMDQQFRS